MREALLAHDPPLSPGPHERIALLELERRLVPGRVYGRTIPLRNEIDLDGITPHPKYRRELYPVSRRLRLADRRQARRRYHGGARALDDAASRERSRHTSGQRVRRLVAAPPREKGGIEQQHQRRTEIEGARERARICGGLLLRRKMRHLEARASIVGRRVSLFARAGRDQHGAAGGEYARRVSETHLVSIRHVVTGCKT